MDGITGFSHFVKFCQVLSSFVKFCQVLSAVRLLKGHSAQAAPALGFSRLSCSSSMFSARGNLNEPRC